MQLACLCLDLYSVKSEKENGSNSPFIHSCGTALFSVVSLVYTGSKRDQIHFHNSWKFHIGFQRLSQKPG